MSTERIQIIGGFPKPDLSEVNAKIAELEEQVASISDILYEPITIKSFSPSPSKVEKGSTVSNPTLTWTTSKTPTTLMVDGEQLEASAKNKPVTGSFNMQSPGNWTLTVTDEREKSATRTTSIAFYDAVYYGSISADVDIDNDAILALTKDIRASRGGSFKTTQTLQRGIFVCPTTYGTPQFKIGETPLPYTWEQVNTEPFMLENEHQYTNPSGYNIWRSGRDIVAKGTNITVV